LEALLSGTLPDGEQGQLTEHIEGCESCQKALEILAGNSREELARRLADPPVPPEPALQEVMRDALGGATQAADDAVDGGEESLAFLAPPREPGDLGRLGHYEVHKVLGQGGFGVVLKAFDERLHRVVAIKVLSPAYAAKGSARKRFIREARAAAAVKNEHVVGIYDVQDDANPPYLVMELIDGVSLQDKLDRQGSLGVKEILRIGMQMAEGLAAAHKQGLVHRDIKPANILLENGVERVRITDFGLARAVDDASLTQSGTVAGTPMYMSPEQAEGVPIDHRSDLFSLGTVLYTMCTGRPPFRADSTMAVLKRVIDDTPRPIREVTPDIPGWLCDIIAKLHAKKPADRFQSATEVAELLSQHLAHLQQPGEVPMPAPVRLSGKRGRVRRRRWRLVAVPAVLIALVAAAILILAWQSIEMYLSDAGQLTINDFNPEFEEFRVERVTGAVKVEAPGTSVRVGTGDWKLKPREPLRLPSGKYQVSAVGRGGEKPTRWQVAGSGVFSGFTAQYELEACPVEIKPGERVQVSVAKWEARAPGGSPADNLPDRARLQGTWVGVAGWNSGLQIPDEQINQIRVTFTGGRMHIEQPGRHPDEGTFHLEPGANPKEIDVIGTDQKGRFGIYRFDGDHLDICMGEDNARPRDFQSDPQFPTRLSLVLRRKDALSGDAAGAFAIPARDGRNEQSFATLTDAVTAARSGDAIEIRGNGPFISPPIEVDGKSLTIQAAPGFRPVLRLNEAGEKANRPLLHADAPLALEGLELQRFVPAETASDPTHAARVVSCIAAPLWVANCRLLVKGGGAGAAVFLSRCPSCVLRNCELLVATPHATAIDYYRAGAYPTVSVVNCVQAGSRSAMSDTVQIHYLDDHLPEATFALTRNTLVCDAAIMLLVDKPPVIATGPKSAVFATGNVFDERLSILHTHCDPSRNPPEADEVRRLLARRFSWRDKENLYALSVPFLTYARRGLEPLEGARDRVQWDGFWGLEETGSRQGRSPRYQGDDLRARLCTEPEKVSATDFRLADGSLGSGLGAEVDKVGPGNAYDEWRKTDLYRTWRQTIDGLMKRP
jgi:serine/threonine-protein kinase